MLNPTYTSASAIVTLLTVMVKVRTVSSTLTVNCDLSGTEVWSRSSLKVSATVVKMRTVPPSRSSVGRMPSTLWLASIATALWSRSAAVVLPVAVIVPPVSVFAAIATPFGAESFSTTV